MENPNPYDQQLSYDLRQYYAQIVGNHLLLISDARIAREYSKYFYALENLFVIVKHKFKPKSKIEGNYKDLKQKLIDISNTYRDCWMGQSNDSKEIAEIETALRKVEMFLWSKMDEAKMFGSKRELEGLS